MKSKDSGYIAFNDGKLDYEIEGNGEPIVFIHGFTLDHRMWQPQVDALKNHFRLITYDVRGFGKSSLPTGSYNHHDDLNALLKELNIESAHIVGLSMGGRIAVNFALEYPYMVRSLALLDAALDGYASDVNWDVHAEDEGVEQAKLNWLSHDLFAATQSSPDLVKALSAMVADYSGWHWLNQDPQSPSDTNAKNRLEKIRASTLVVVGELDLSYFHDIAGVLVEGIPSAALKVIPKVGHMVNMEAPNDCNELLVRHVTDGPTGEL